MNPILKNILHAAIGGAVAGVAPTISNTVLPHVDPMLAAVIGSAVSSVLSLNSEKPKKGKHRGGAAKALLLVFVLSLAAGDVSAQSSFPARRFCEQSAGTTIAAKLRNCALSLPSGGGIMDASGIVTNGANVPINQALFTGITKPVTWILSYGVHRFTTSQTIPSNVAIVLNPGSTFSTATGVTVTVNGPVCGAAAITTAGTGTVDTTGSSACGGASSSTGFVSGGVLAGVFAIQ